MRYARASRPRKFVAVKNNLITAAFLFFASMAFAQSNIKPPDLLGTDSTPATNVSKAQGSPPVTEDAIETDKEPIPIIRKKAVTSGSMNSESRYIEHPNAEKGLIKIDKNKVYYYRVKESDQRGAGNFKIGFYEPTNLMSTSASNLGYGDIYDASQSPLFLYEHEWQFFKSAGRLGITAGGGFFFASGNGQFQNGQPLRPREKFTLFVFPVNAGLIYRAQFYDTQPIAPYAGAGIGGMLFAERRDDDQNPALGARYGAAPVGHFYAGLAIQLGHGARSFLDLDREYGINKVWVTGEYRQFVFVSGKFDFSGDAINGGLSAEF